MRKDSLEGMKKEGRSKEGEEGEELTSAEYQLTMFTSIGNRSQPN